MKQFIMAAFITFVFSILLMMSSVSHAFTFYSYGIWYGNVCRFGAYYQFVPYAPVGYQCYMPAWNLYGFITNE